MKEKPKLYWRIKALLFAGAISAASLRGCTYGPPPVPNDYKGNQDVTIQYLSDTSDRENSVLEVKNEPEEKF